MNQVAAVPISVEPVRVHASPAIVVSKLKQAEATTEQERRREAAERAAHTSILYELFATLLPDLQLTEEERLEFMSLLVEARRSAMDANRLGRAASLTDKDAFAKLVRDAAMSVDPKLVAMLGERRFEIFVQYRATLEGRTTVRHLQAHLAGSGHELSSDQSSEVIRLYTQKQQQSPRYSPEVYGILQATGTTLDDRILDALTPALSEKQLEALIELRYEQEGRIKLQEEYAARVRAKGKR